MRYIDHHHSMTFNESNAMACEMDPFTSLAAVSSVEKVDYQPFHAATGRDSIQKKVAAFCCRLDSCSLLRKQKQAMKGYLYVEEDLLGKPNRTFTRRYFISYRFCGLKWFSKEPNGIRNAVYLQCIANDTCGWIYGGNVIPEQVEIEDEMRHRDNVVFPFTVSLKCGEYYTSVKLACKTEEMRRRWVDELNLSIRMLSFVESCHQSDVLPSAAIFDAVRDRTDDHMTLSTGPLNVRHLYALANYYSFTHPHGLLLHSIHLENCQINDNMMSVVCGIIEQASYLGVLSLSGNCITSTGAAPLCETLLKCKYLTEVNLSNNFLCDQSADGLSRALGLLTELRVLNLSHNRFTSAAVRAFTLRLATHRSKLRKISFALNALGDGIATFVSLLCANEPSLLQEVDISFCELTDLGGMELASALLKCSSLLKINLRGGYFNAKCLQQLIKCQGEHHMVHQRARKGAGLCIELGGATQDTTHAAALSLKALKSSLLYVADIAHIRRIVLRRRLLYAQPLAHHTTADDLINPLHRLQHQLQEAAEEAYPVIQLAVMLPAYLKSVYEWLEELALQLECDPNQLVLLGCTRTESAHSATHKKSTTASLGKTTQFEPVHDTNNTNTTYLYTVVFTVLNVPANRITARRDYSYMHSFPHIMGTTTHRIVEKLLTPAALSAIAAVPNVNPVTTVTNNTVTFNTTSTGATDKTNSGALKLLNYQPGAFVVADNTYTEDNAEHKLYKAAFIRPAIDIVVSLHEEVQNNSPYLRAVGVRYVALKYPNPAYLESPTEPEFIVFQANIRQCGVKGSGLSDHYTPLLYPHMPSTNVSLYDGLEGTDDDETFDILVRTRPDPSNISEDNLKNLPSLDANDTDETITGALAAALGTGLTNVELEHQYVTASEEHMLRSLQVRNHRAVNERLIIAVRQLYADKEISSVQAKFWEGAFGALKHKQATQAGLKSALHAESGTFVAIYLRQQLYEAMFQRDLPRMNDLIAEFQRRSPAQGGLALVYALRLRSEILTLQRAYLDVSDLARSYNELSMVEDYLLQCGRLGYAGPEMFQAVELRQQLVALAVNKKRRSVLVDLPTIKFKALICNLLISREVDALKHKMVALNSESPKSDMLHTPECIAVDTMLSEHYTTMNLVNSAIKSKSVDAIDAALAQAAYHFFYAENVTSAVTVLNETCNNPTILLRPLVEALRAGDVSHIEGTFKMISAVGWTHPAAQAVVVNKIHDRQNKIVQDEMVKSRLIKYCLAIKNGLKVNSNELMQLLRRSYKLKLDEDPVMSAYLKTASKSVKQFAGLLKQEKSIQHLIDTNDVTTLARTLDGRGSGKLVMCAPSAYVQDEWMYYLQACCEGKFKNEATDEEGNIREQEVFFTGTLEKAARNDQGLVRGWRQRFFQLNTTSLSYFTKPRGDRKGIIRVLGGGVRRMDASETGGRPFCLELEEGRDISLIDPDLLAEGRRHVLQAKTREFESAVRRGISQRSLDLLTRMLRYASDSNIILDFNLIAEAKQCINTLKEKNLKRDLRFAAKLVPRSQLDELISLAQKLSLDPNIPSYRTVLSLATKSEVEQHLIRARGALEVHDENLFKRAFYAISRFDLTLLTTKQRAQLAALILQHSGYHVLYLATTGTPLSGATRINKHALACCLQLLVETEPMDLARLLVALAHRTITVDNNSSYVSHAFFATADTRADKTGSIAVYLEDLNINYASNPQYDITKYKQLRISSVYRYKGLGISAALQSSRRRNDKSNEIMRYSTVPLLKSLLKYEAAVAVNNRLHLEAFSILLVIMGDKTLSSLSRPTKGGVLQTRPTTLSSIVTDMIVAATSTYPVMRNELYFQLIKQLTENPEKRSWVRGWLLMTLYLHSFAPTYDALPYIRNYVDVSKESALNELYAHASRQNSSNTTTSSGTESPAKLPAFQKTTLSETDLTALTYATKLMTYCSTLLSRIDIMLHNSKAAYHDTSGSPLLFKPIVASTSAHYTHENAVEIHSTIHPTMVDRVYEQKGLDFEIALMTGTVLKFSLPFGQCSTPYSILCYLYDKLLPEDAFFETAHHSYQQPDDALAGEEMEKSGPSSTRNSVNIGSLANITSGANNATGTSGVGSSSYLSPEMKAHRVMSLFKGFAFYSLRESDYDLEENEVNLQQIPVQPEYSMCIDWTKDIQWDLLQLHDGEETGNTHDTSSSVFKYSNTLLLRRKTSMLHETFSDEFELFADQVSDRDVTALQALWAKWLSADVVSLPSDHVRVDLVYAEDTRYVNSKLYPLSEESLHYLIALQLALCWCDDSAEDWAELDEGVMVNATVSVRPCYKFPPQHLIEAPVGNARQGLTMAQELELIASENALLDAQTAHSVSGQSSDSDDSSLEREVARRNKAYLQHDDEDENNSDTSSEYMSSVESQSIPEPVVLVPLTSTELSEDHQALLVKLLALIGVPADSVDVTKLVQRMVQFHAVAVESNIGVASPKYRYLLKRAYIHYLSAACSFYGHHFAEAVLVPEKDNKTQKKKAKASKKTKKGTTGSIWENVESSGEESGNDTQSINSTPTDVLVSVSVGALALLDPETWNVRFSCPIWDIQDFSVIVGERGMPLLVLSISGKEIALKGAKVHEILDMIDSCTREALGRGFFPFGSDAATVTLVSQTLGMSTANGTNNTSNTGHYNSNSSVGGIFGGVLTNSTGHSNELDGQVQLHDAKKLIMSFLHTFPMLPRPPIPDTAQLATVGYIPTPKSQRDLFAKERAEEERLEHEMTRAAAEAQLERNQRHIEQGQKDMRKYQKSASAKGAEDGEGSDNSDAEEVGAGSRASARKSKRKVNRSVFGDVNTTAEIRMQMLQERVSAVACGVSRKTSSRFGEIVIPAAPMRVGGVVKLVTTNDKKRTLRKPMLVESRGLKEALDRPMVSLSLATEAALPVSGASAVAGAAGGAAGATKNKRGKEGSVVFVAPTPASESTLLSWSHDRLQSAILEQSAAVSMVFQHRVENNVQNRLRSAELVHNHTVSHLSTVTEAGLEENASHFEGSDVDGSIALSQLNLQARGSPGHRAEEGNNASTGRDPYLHGVSFYMKKKSRAGPGSPMRQLE